jgi:superfamily I DNA/RNA helicase
MAKHSFKEPSDAMRDARILVENGKLEDKYSSVVVDEGQDFSQQGFMLLRSIVQDGKNDMFIVGDAHQRIYGHKVTLGQCGIKIVGRSRKLKLNYRTTDEIRKWAVKIFKSDTIDDLDSGVDSNKDYKSLYHGPEPLVKNLESYEAEIAFLKSYIDDLVKEDSSQSICVMLRTKKLVSEYKNSLDKLGVSTYVLNKDSKDDSSKIGIRLATMHRIKGLDFDHVIIPHANQGIIPLQSLILSDEELIEEEMLLKEKSLLFVSATRAKKTLLVTGFGEMSSFVVTI